MVVFGPDPADVYTWRDGDSDLGFLLATSVFRRFAKQWKSRALAQEVSLKEIPKSKLRLLQVPKRAFECVDAQVGASVILHKQIGRTSAPKWSGPAMKLEKDETGVAMKFRDQP